MVYWREDKGPSASYPEYSRDNSYPRSPFPPRRARPGPGPHTAGVFLEPLFLEPLNSVAAGVFLEPFAVGVVSYEGGTPVPRPPPARGKRLRRGMLGRVLGAICSGGVAPSRGTLGHLLGERCRGRDAQRVKGRTRLLSMAPRTRALLGYTAHPLPQEHPLP